MRRGITEANVVTASEFRYLNAIESVKSEKGRAIMTDIAQKLCYARASVYKKLLALEQQGLIVKEDGKFVEMTKKGKEEYLAAQKFAGLCADILSEKSGLDKRFLSHDAVEMACALSARCRNALLNNSSIS